MTNHPVLRYKPVLNMDDSLVVAMQAGDWAMFLHWLGDQDSGQLAHLIHGIIIPQIRDMLYTPESLKAIEAHIHDQARRQSPLAQVLQDVGGFPMSDFMDRPDMKQTWIIECADCGSQDEYPPEYGGPLTCEHNGLRRLVKMIIQPLGENT